MTDDGASQRRRRARERQQAAAADGAALEGLVRALLADREWMADAACRGVGPDAFYADGPASPGGAGSYDGGRAYCDGCPVVEECADAGMSDQHGLWGGLSPRDRRRLRRSTA